MEVDQVIRKLKTLADPKAVEGMAKFGINPKNTLGVKVPQLRKMAKEIGKNSALAQRLWKTKIHEARILASMIADPKDFTENEMDEWVKDFDSWDICDQCCMNLFDKTEIAFKKAIEWAHREEEFVRRAGFALMACLAWHRKDVADKKFLKFFPVIKKFASDERNFVKKAVNWALRQIGKRSKFLKDKAIKIAKEIQKIDSRSAHWIAADALRELNKKKV